MLEMTCPTLTTGWEPTPTSQRATTRLSHARPLLFPRQLPITATYPTEVPRLLDRDHQCTYPTVILVSVLLNEGPKRGFVKHEGK